MYILKHLDMYFAGINYYGNLVWTADITQAKSFMGHNAAGHGKIYLEKQGYAVEIQAMDVGGMFGPC